MRRERLQGPALEQLLLGLREALTRAFDPERILLFGSFARGDQNRASDVDLVVIAKTSLSFIERIGRALGACQSVANGLPVEVLVYTPAEWARMTDEGYSFVRLVEKEGRVLHEREPQSERGAALARAGAA